MPNTTLGNGDAYVAVFVLLTLKTGTMSTIGSLLTLLVITPNILEMNNTISTSHIIVMLLSSVVWLHLLLL